MIKNKRFMETKGCIWKSCRQSLLVDFVVFLTRCTNLTFIIAVVSFCIHELDAECSDPAAQGGRGIFSSKEAKAKFLQKTVAQLFLAENMEE